MEDANQQRIIQLMITLLLKKKALLNSKRPISRHLKDRHLKGAYTTTFLSRYEDEDPSALRDYIDDFASKPHLARALVSNQKSSKNIY